MPASSWHNVVSVWPAIRSIANGWGQASGTLPCGTQPTRMLRRTWREAYVKAVEACGAPFPCPPSAMLIRQPPCCWVSGSCRWLPTLLRTEPQDLRVIDAFRLYFPPEAFPTQTVAQAADICQAKGWQRWKQQFWVEGASGAPKPYSIVCEA